MDASAPAGGMKLGSLQARFSDCPLAKLEGGTEVGLRILDEIKAAFENAKSMPEIAGWINSIDELQSQTAYQRSVVGVVGSTGAGKSSVINAVLDEECLVPTNW
jgi:ribosome biogenesis GTPase A